MGINCAPLVAFYFAMTQISCYLSQSQADTFEVFNSTNRCLNNLLNIDNIYFEHRVIMSIQSNFSKIKPILLIAKYRHFYLFFTFFR